MCQFLLGQKSCPLAPHARAHIPGAWERAGVAQGLCSLWQLKAPGRGPSSRWVHPAHLPPHLCRRSPGTPGLPFSQGRRTCLCGQGLPPHALYMQTVQWLQYPPLPACLNCAGIKHQPLRASCVTSTLVLAKSLVPLRGRRGQPSPHLAWSWISPATVGPKQVLKAARFPVSYQVSAEGSTASQFLLVPTRDIGLGSKLPASTRP